MNPTQSYLKVQYELRSAKQVERRMIIDGLQILSSVGFDIAEYQYTGFGSIYFVDFTLFHKFLGIRRMWTVEHDSSIARRVRFNKPFRFVKVHMADAGEVVGRLPLSRRHLVWLDYDNVMNGSLAEHAYLAASRLPAGSILLVTVDVEPPTRNGDPRRWKEYFTSEVGRYLPTDAKFGASKLTLINVRVLDNVFRSALAARQGLQFQPLFSFLYKDGHEMLTMGGMVASQEDLNRIRSVPHSRAPYMRFSFNEDPYYISVPRLTRRERSYLDAAMPAPSGWTPIFELDERSIQAYRSIYRFFPVYAELFL